MLQGSFQMHYINYNVCVQLQPPGNHPVTTLATTLATTLQPIGDQRGNHPATSRQPPYLATIQQLPW